ncbi:MAG: hypothetical protein ACR2PW_05535 [Gammaproteobacteria bacterium]
MLQVYFTLILFLLLSAPGNAQTIHGYSLKFYLGTENSGAQDIRSRIATSKQHMVTQLLQTAQTQQRRQMIELEERLIHLREQLQELRLSPLQDRYIINEIKSELRSIASRQRRLVADLTLQWQQNRQQSLIDLAVSTGDSYSAALLLDNLSRIKNLNDQLATMDQAQIKDYVTLANIRGQILRIMALNQQTIAQIATHEPALQAEFRSYQKVYLKQLRPLHIDYRIVHP